MKSVVLKGIKINIGSKVRFIDDRNLYEDCDGVIFPEIGKVYTVRGFSIKGFFLEEIINDDIEWLDENGQTDSISEPGFGSWRFEPYQPMRKKITINCSFEKIIEERLDIKIPTETQ